MKRAKLLKLAGVYLKDSRSMKPFIFKILTFSILGFSAIFITCSNHRGSGTKILPGNKIEEKKSPGKIVFDKEIHNFGTLKDGEIISYSFLFRNIGGSPVKIVKAEKSCGCIEVRFSENPISAGDSAVVEVILNTAGEWGNVIREATIVTSEGEHKELKIGAYIENEQFNNNLLNTQK